MKIIGITEGHTATAALMIDGEIVACASEERFNRKKGSEGYPRKAIDYVMQFVDKDEIDLVVSASLFFNPEIQKINRESTFSMQDHIDIQNNYFYPLLVERKDPIEVKKKYFGKLFEEKAKVWKWEYDDEGFEITFDAQKDAEEFNKVRKKTIVNQIGVPEEKVLFMPHHKSHAAYAYYASPFRGKDCVVLTADGMGDYENATISIVKDDKIEQIFETKTCDIAKMWRYATLILGMKPQQHEYKVMGLAPYADQNIVKKAYNIYKEHLVVDGFDFKYNKKPDDLYFYFKDLFEGIRFDGIAGGIQQWTEEMVTTWIRNIVKKTGIKRIVFSGGLAMNIKINKIIHEMDEVEELFVAPSGGDESLAMGACYLATRDTPKALDHVYLGPEYSDEEVYEVLKKAADTGKYELVECDAKFIGKQLAEGKTIARFSGRMEFGARALGNRSINSHPQDPAVIKKINTQIKNRDFWMPFTPSILKDREFDYIINPKNIPAPFMTIAFESTQLGKEHLKGAIHPYDETVRAQLVERETAPGYYDMIKEFEKITGIGAVLNTSLNLHGDAVVCTPEDAVYTMDNSGLDILFANEKYALIRK